MEFDIELVAESLSKFGSRLNIVREKPFKFKMVRMLSASMDELHDDTLYVCEPSMLYKLAKNQLRSACFVTHARPSVFEKYKGYINAIIIDDGVSMNDVINYLIELFTRMTDYEYRLHQAVLMQSGYEPLFEISREMFPGCTTLMVDSGYNIVCSSDSVGDRLRLPGANAEAVAHVDRLLAQGFYDKQELDQMAEHRYYNQGDKYLTPVLSCPPNVCGCPLVVRSYHENNTFFAFITCYFYYGVPTLVQQRLFKLLSDSLDDYFEITDYYEHVRPFHQQFIADLIRSSDNSNEDFYRDRCLRLHLPQSGNFRMGLIYVSPANSVRASHFALQLKAWCSMLNYGVFQYGSTVIILFVNWRNYSVSESAELHKNWTSLLETIRNSGAYVGISLPFKHISEFSTAYHQAVSAAKQGRSAAPDQLVYFFSKYYINDLLDCYAEHYPLSNLCTSYLENLSFSDRCGYSDLVLLYYYITSERNISLTGKKMHMHRNSVIYRLQRINDTLDLDLDDPDVRLRLMLTFKVLERQKQFTPPVDPDGEPVPVSRIE